MASEGSLYYRKNISERSEGHKRCCEILFIAVSSDKLEILQMLPPAPHERFRRKFSKMCERQGLHLLKIKSHHSSSFRWSQQVPKGNWPCGGGLVD